jgi:hypothetical protein
MICDPTAYPNTVKYAKPWRQSVLHPAPIPAHSRLRISLWVSAKGSATLAISWRLYFSGGLPESGRGARPNSFRGFLEETFTADYRYRQLLVYDIPKTISPG